ncbi:hypothetical protein PIROE2DRAFT_5599 [Piromyces sp. E2]|nr:hypothetical protein PIROE2DRAFT_5599 [Piromyces sp. E2]|eukprot:OUM67102.1 hypothetical protein PIROE2DRAFT_5599 [Piromyces sp. E2]
MTLYDIPIEYNDDILNLLKAYNIKVTFFVVVRLLYDDSSNNPTNINIHQSFCHFAIVNWNVETVDYVVVLIILNKLLIQKLKIVSLS